MSEELEFSREVIKDGTLLSILWLRFVRYDLYKLGLGYYFDNPAGIHENAKDHKRGTFYGGEYTPFSTRGDKFPLFIPCPQQFYLTLTINVQTQFYFTRLRLLTLRFFGQINWCLSLVIIWQFRAHCTLCYFAPSIKSQEEIFLVPILKEIRPCSYIEGFNYLHSLATHAICIRVSNYIKVAMAVRKLY